MVLELWLQVMVITRGLALLIQIDRANVLKATLFMLLTPRDCPFKCIAQISCHSLDIQYKLQYTTQYTFYNIQY